MATILVVDDSASLRMVVAMALSGAGHEVLQASDGKSALKMLDGRKINMIISDLNMPNMNGIDFAVAAKMIPMYKFTPILMLTTESQVTKKEQGRAAGIKAWMVKPFATASLISAVTKLCA